MSQPQWVKLYLVPQTDNSHLPPFALGCLTSETPAYYVLNPMLDMELSEDGTENELVEQGMNFISKTYVWRCQILEQEPNKAFINQEQEGYEDELDGGGLG